MTGDAQRAEAVLDARDVEALRLRWLQRDEAAVHRILAPVLGAAGIEAFERAVHPSDHGDGPAAAMQAIEEFVRPDRPGGGTAEDGRRREIVAVAYAYFAILVEWEVSGVHDWLRSLAGALCETVEGLDRPGEAVFAAVVALAQALPKQLECERALFCTAPVLLEQCAGEVVSLLAPRFAGADRPECGDADVAVADCLADLVQREGEAALALARFQCDTAAPAALQFLHALTPDCPPDEVAAALAAVDAACESVEAVLVSPALTGSVYRSEVRPYALAFDRMRDALSGAAPRVAVDAADIVMMYPFGLPGFPVPPHDLVQCALGEDIHAEATGKGSAVHDRMALLHAAGLVGTGARSITVHPHVTSDVFSHFALIGAGHEGVVGARLMFPEHRLMLRTASGQIVEDLDLEIRLGSYGNHCVRIACSTRHHVDDRNNARPPGEVSTWTPHDVDQWIRRASAEMGDERVWLQTRDGEDVIGSECSTLVELAGALVGSLERILYADEGGAHDDEATRIVPGHARLNSRFNDLAANAHVLVVVTDARTWTGTEAPRRMPSGADLAKAVGAAAFCAPQRALPVTVADWVCFDADPDVPNLFRDWGRPGDVLSVNGDLTLLAAFGSPNWATLETRDIVEFGISTIGPLSAWSVWLRQTARDSERTVRKANNDGSVERLRDTSVEIAKHLGHVRSLLDRLRSVQLARSFRDRELLARFREAAGVHDLQRSLDDSIASVQAQHSYSTEMTERVVETRRRRTERTVAILGAVIALGGILTFADWVHSGWHWRVEATRWWVLAVLVLAGLAVTFDRLGWFSQEHTRRQHAVSVLAGVAAFVAVVALATLDEQVGVAVFRSVAFDVFLVVVVVAFVAFLVRRTSRPEPSRDRRVVLIEPDAEGRQWLRTAYDKVLVPAFRGTGELASFASIERAVMGAEGAALVALEGVAVVGIAVTEMAPEPRLGLLSYLATRPRSRGRGAGGLLMDALVPLWAGWPVDDALGEVEDARVHHRTRRNKPRDRLRFYERLGARVVATPWTQPALGGGTRVRGLLLLRLWSRDPDATGIEGARLAAWADDYYLAEEGALPDDAEYVALRARLAAERVDVVAIADLEDALPLNPH